MEKFNMYKFADYKEHVIDLLKRVCTVSVRNDEGGSGDGALVWLLAGDDKRTN